MRSGPFTRALIVLTLLTASASVAQEEYSGIYPHLAFFNDENECGTGAVVPWAGRLWAITYAPHKPTGSSDRLYEITPGLELIVRPESIGGTPANRMIHRESKQLFIGPYAIDANGKVRVIPPSAMFGRLTGTARHLDDPAGRVYVATMEEGFYEVDVDDLSVKTLYHDEQVAREPKAGLPGYHGKGLYSGQDRLVYANNGENSPQARKNPFIPSGVLAEWDGTDWRVVRRGQFTEVTGPGGIRGNENPSDDPIWSVGWDARSLVVMLLDQGRWHAYRLPKASHSYDGAHGWNTEWPRIREIGGDDLLMTMHGMFWRFPKTFTASSSKGIVPRSTYLKVVGDFCRFGDRVVCGCDDTARNEFLNRRKAKGRIAPPQSQSNLWFLDPDELDRLGPVIGRGAVWLDEEVAAGAPSDPFLLSGFTRRGLHLVTGEEAAITLEIDERGDGRWKDLTRLRAGGYVWYSFPESLDAVWVRLSADRPLRRATAWFHYSGSGRGDTGAAREDRGPGRRDASPADGLFAGLARRGDAAMTGGIIRAQGGNKRTLELAARNAGGFSRLRPVATHDRAIFDYCSYRGLLVLSGVNLAEAGENRHVIVSDDGRTGLWVGAIDDLWRLGKPIGRGGPWTRTPAEAGERSDPYLMTGYDRKRLFLAGTEAATITAEIDITGMGNWCVYRSFTLPAHEEVRHRFPDAFQAYWIRFVSDTDTIATARLTYE